MSQETDWKAMDIALNRGEKVNYNGMVMQRLPDGLYIDGVKAKIPKEGEEEVELEKVPIRARPTDRRTPTLELPPEITETLVYPCPICPVVSKTEHGRLIHFGRSHSGRRPTQWPEPVSIAPPQLLKIEEEPMPAGPTISTSQTDGRNASSEAAESEASQVREPELENLARITADPGQLEVAAKIEAAPPWTPTYARVDQLLKAMGNAAEALIPLSRRDQGIVMTWLDNVLAPDTSDLPKS